MHYDPLCGVSRRVLKYIDELIERTRDGVEAGGAIDEHKNPRLACKRLGIPYIPDRQRK